MNSKSPSVALLAIVVSGLIVGPALTIDQVPIPAPPQNSDVKDKLDSPKIFVGINAAPPEDQQSIAACETELQAQNIVFKAEPEIAEPEGCRAMRPLRVGQLSNHVKLSTIAIARCPLILALDNWLTEAAQPAARDILQTEISAINISTSYQCRTRYAKKGAKISEHGFANAIDIIGFQFADDSSFAVSPKGPRSKESQVRFQQTVRQAACRYFTTVLGPGSNAAHDTHFHFDLAYRKGGYRLCE